MQIPNELLATIAVAIFGSSGFWLIVQQILERKSTMRSMVLGIGYERIVSACKKHIDAGWISVNELEDLENLMYEPYRKMGGNGTAKVLMEKVAALPNKPPEAK